MYVLVLNNLYFLSFDCKKLQNVILYLVNKIESFYYAQSLESNSKRHIFHFNPVNLGQGCMYFFSSIADKQGFNFMQRKKNQRQKLYYTFKRVLLLQCSSWEGIFEEEPAQSREFIKSFSTLANFSLSLPPQKKWPAIHMYD